jgi:hypothetical protein
VTRRALLRAALAAFVLSPSKSDAQQVGSLSADELRRRVLEMRDALSLPAVSDTKPDFSGTWRLDVEKSYDNPKVALTGPETLIIRQTEKQLTIERRTPRGFPSQDIPLGAFMAAYCLPDGSKWSGVARWTDRHALELFGVCRQTQEALISQWALTSDLESLWMVGLRMSFAHPADGGPSSGIKMRRIYGKS